MKTQMISLFFISYSSLRKKIKVAQNEKKHTDFYSKNMYLPTSISPTQALNLSF